VRRAIKRIDVTNVPDLMRLAEEVRASQEPRMLTRDHEALAILMSAGEPLKRGRRRRLPQGQDQCRLRGISVCGWRVERPDR
jgi:hypothetical protein